MSALQTKEISNFEANLLRANLQLLQNRIKTLQEENVLLTAKNRRLEEDKSELYQQLQRLSSYKENTLPPRGYVQHTKSFDGLDPPTFTNNTYNSATPSTRGSAMMYSQYTDEVGVYSDSLKAPVWEGSSHPPQRGRSHDNFLNERDLPLSQNDDAGYLGPTSLSQDGHYGDKCPHSTTAIGGSSTYINSLLKMSRSPSPPPPAVLSRGSSSRMTLPLNYSSKKASLDLKRSRSFRDSRRYRWNHTGEIPSISPSMTSMLNSTAPPETRSLSGPQTSVDTPTASTKDPRSPRRQGRHSRSFIFCFFRPLTND